MICSNCGTQNATESKFCIKCGTALQVNASTSGDFFVGYNSQTEGNPIGQNHTQVVQEPVNMNSTGNMVNPEINPQDVGMTYSTVVAQTSEVKMSLKDYFFSIIAVILKPSTSMDEEKDKYSDIKNSLILTLIVTIIASIISLVNSMISVVKVTSFSSSTWSYETEYVWENLKELNYFKVIGQNLLVYAGIIVAIALIYYLGCLIIKKNAVFSRMIAISAIGVVPAIICTSVLSPVLSLISSDVGFIVSVLGLIYSLIIIYENINDEINLEGNMRYYFNTLCLSILIIGAYYIFMNVLVSSITSDYSSILNMLGY